MKALKGRKDFHPDATSARLAKSPDGPKNRRDSAPTGGNTQIQSRPSNPECQVSVTFKAIQKAAPGSKMSPERPACRLSTPLPVAPDQKKYSYEKNTTGTQTTLAGICPLFLSIAQSDNRSSGLCRRPRRA